MSRPPTRRNSAAIAADIVHALILADRTVSDLSEIVYGNCNYRPYIIPYVDNIKEVGHIRIIAYDKNGFAIYRWQTQAFAEPDIQKPEWGRVDKQSRSGRPERLIEVNGHPMTYDKASQITGWSKSTLRKMIASGRKIELRSKPS